MLPHILQLKQTMQPILQRHAARRAGLFGSMARGDMTEASDVDLLVELPQQKSLLDLIRLKYDLEEVLGRKVDVTTYQAIHPRLKEQILLEEVPIFMVRDARFYIQDMLECITLIEEYTLHLSYQDFLGQRQAQDSVIRRLEIIGEAVKNLSRDFRQTYPEVPWRDLAGLRDVLIHNYLGVDLHEVWQIIEVDLPQIKPQLSHILSEL